MQIVVHHGFWPHLNEIIGMAFRYASVTTLYVEAANGFLRDRLAFGSSSFRTIGQSIRVYQALGFKDDVLEAVFYGNANGLLSLAARG